VSAILVVDDEPAVTRVLQLQLEGAGHQVRVAHDGEQALKMLREEPFDLVITDICMPRMDGRQFCEQVRSERPDGEPLIFVVSSRPEDEYRSWTQDLPNIEFLEKPLSLRRLMTRVALRLGEAAAAEANVR
jgi:DNA-binding response OmpR family regulator